jgi:hypothetical protein
LVLTDRWDQEFWIPVQDNRTFKLSLEFRCDDKLSLTANQRDNLVMAVSLGIRTAEEMRSLMTAEAKATEAARIDEAQHQVQSARSADSCLEGSSHAFGFTSVALDRLLDRCGAAVKERPAPPKTP